MAGFYVVLGGIILIVLCGVVVGDKRKPKKVRTE